MGPVRLVAAGVAPARPGRRDRLLRVACVAGFVLAAVTSWWVMRGGRRSLDNTGGRHPYGYHGLGDIAVFVFFGLVADPRLVKMPWLALAAALPQWGCWPARC